jgi:hypothetical protein
MLSKLVFLFYLFLLFQIHKIAALFLQLWLSYKNSHKLKIIDEDDDLSLCTNGVLKSNEEANKYSRQRNLKNIKSSLEYATYSTASASPMLSSRTLSIKDNSVLFDYIGNF